MFSHLFVKETILYNSFLFTLFLDVYLQYDSVPRNFFPRTGEKKLLWGKELSKTREIPAFGGISLAFRGSGTFDGGKKKLGCHGRPIFGAVGPPRPGRQLTPPSAAIEKEKFGRFGRPKWF